MFYPDPVNPAGYFYTMVNSMAYVSLDRFILVFGEIEASQLLDRQNCGSNDEDIYDIAAIKADSLINSYLRGCFTVPFTAPVSPTILNIAEAITRYELYSTDPSETVTKLYEEALALLAKIKDGLLALADGNGDPIDSIAGLGQFRTMALVRA